LDKPKCFIKILLLNLTLKLENSAEILTIYFRINIFIGKTILQSI